MEVLSSNPPVADHLLIEQNFNKNQTLKNCCELVPKLRRWNKPTSPSLSTVVIETLLQVLSRAMPVFVSVGVLNFINYINITFRKILNLYYWRVLKILVIAGWGNNRTEPLQIRRSSAKNSFCAHFRTIRLTQRMFVIASKDLRPNNIKKTPGTGNFYIKNWIQNWYLISEYIWRCMWIKTRVYFVQDFP